MRGRRPWHLAGAPARLAVLLALLTGVLRADGAAAASGPAAAPGSGRSAAAQNATAAAADAATLRVFLVTVGQGSFIWEKFGHNAIWLRDEAAGTDVAYNWGVFDFDQPGFTRRLIRGDMLYRIEAYPGIRLINSYIADNRSVWIQELNLAPTQKAELRAFVEWNNLPENKFYRYDYYRDNCSTRVRDALDRVLGGALKQQLAGKPTGTTYRQHTERLTADLLPEYSGLLVALGPNTDRPIDAWEESFLPVQLMEQVRDVQVQGLDGQSRPLVLSETAVYTADRAAERTSPPNRLPWYGLVGLGCGVLLFLLGRLSGRLAGAGFFTLAVVWALLTGIVGTLIAGLWAFTDHVITYNNENVLQANPLSLILFVLLVLSAFGRARKAALTCATLVAGLALLGFVLQALPQLNQPNGTAIAFLLPAHCGLFLGLRARLRRAVAHGR